MSYNHNDRKIVSRVISWLEEAGIEIWWDGNLAAGERWMSVLDTALRTSRTLVVFVGPDNVTDFQRDEVHMAEVLGIRIIPVQLPGAPPSAQLPFPLCNLQYHELTDGKDLDELEFNHLLAVIKGESLNAAEQQELIEKRMRAAVCAYYQSQETSCEHLVFRPLQNQTKSRGSDLYVQLHLLSERVQRPDIRARENRENTSAADTSSAQTAANQTEPQEPERDEPKETFKPEQQLTRERESWEMVFRNDGLRLVFTGDAGSGKSFSLAQEIRKRLSLARNELESSRPLDELELPILVKANALVDSPYERVVDALRAALSKSSHESSTVFVDWWNRAFNSDRGRRLFIVIDGLDELPEKSENRFRSLMNELDALEDANIVISCRTMYFVSRRSWIGWISRDTRVIEIAPLNTEQQLELIAKWFSDDARCGALQDFIQNNYFARLFCRAPIILTLVCRVYAATNRLPSQNATYASLYDDVVKELLAGRWREDRPEWTFKHSLADQRSEQNRRIDLISKIAWKIFESSPSSNRFTEAKWLEYAQPALTRAGQKQLDPHALFIELELVGIIADAGTFGDTDYYYSFAHRTLLEYFAAVGLLKTEAKWVKIIVQHMWCESGWEQVIRFAASMSKKPNELLNAVAKETGTATTPVRPLERLEQRCDTTAGLSLAGLFLIGLFIGLFIYNLSDEKRAQLQNHTSHLSNRFQTTSPTDVRQNPFEVAKSRTNDVLQYYALTIDVLHSELESVSVQKKRVLYPALISVHFLWPIILIVTIGSFIGSWLFWLARKILYRRTFANQDDVFRTGLRLQAEIVGLSATDPAETAISKEEIQRVVRELLASEKQDSLKIHGATDEGFIPENLLLLLGGNPTARKTLNEECLPIVKQRLHALGKKNTGYTRLLSLYRWFLRNFSENNVDVTLQPGSIKNLVKLKDRFSSDRILVSNYLRGRLPIDNSFNRVSVDSYVLRKDPPEEDVLSDLNKLILGPSVFDPFEFRHVWLSAETIEMITRAPGDQDVRRLNRLLLEDASSKTLRNIQKPRIRRASRFGLYLVNKFVFSPLKELRDVTTGSELESALRILALMPASNNCDYMESLLAETAKASNSLLNAGETLRTFTNLDVYAAKVLATSGGLDRADKLIQLSSSRNTEENSSLPFAIRELSSVDQVQGIRAAVAFLTGDLKDESSYEISKLKDQAIEVLQVSEFSRVVNEIFKLNIPNDILWRYIFVPVYVKYPSKKARAFLQLVTVSDTLPEDIRNLAHANLRDSHYRSWFHPAEWLEGYAELIRTRLEHGELDSAVSSFDKSISDYSIDYGSNDLTAALDKIAAACDKQLLDKWVGGATYSSKLQFHYRTLARLARGRSGHVVRQWLIEKVKQMDFDHLYPSMYDDSLDIKVAVLQALGELKTPDAEQTLLAIWQRSYLPRRRFRRFLEGSPERFWVALITAMGKFGTDRTFQAIQYEAKKRRSWVICLVAARLLRERDASEALRLFLVGHQMRGSDKWKPEYGVEPQLLDFAFACKARIRKITHEGNWYVATSRTFSSPIRVPIN